ncbi:MAG: WD40 repeat domain-containing protein [Aquisalimonadaceae bacterium]
MVIRWLGLTGLAIGLAGCNPALRVDAGQRAVPPPVSVALAIPLDNEPPRMLVVEHLAFSRNGELILAADSRANVRLYSHDSGALLTSLHVERKHWFERRRLTTAGLLDDDTAFYLSWDGGLFEIWGIAPTELRFSHRFAGIGGEKTTAANADYIAQGEHVLDRGTGELLEGRFLAHYGFSVDYQLTDGSLLFSASPLSRSVVLSDLGQRTQHLWHSGRVQAAAFTASQRYLVVGGSRCQVWRLPDPELAHRCASRWPFGADVTRVTAHPAEDLFAVYQGNAIRVYTLDPFKHLLDIKAPDHIQHLALTVNNRVVFVDREDNLEVWDIATGKLLGKHAFSSVQHLAVHPKTGDVLVAGYDDRRSDQHNLYLLTVDQP